MAQSRELCRVEELNNNYIKSFLEQGDGAAGTAAEKHQPLMIHDTTNYPLQLLLGLRFSRHRAGGIYYLSEKPLLVGIRN